MVHVLRPRYPRKYERAAKTSLQRCVSNALEAATDAGCRTVVFTQFWQPREGDHHVFPHQSACMLFAKSLRSFLELHHQLLDRIILVFEEEESKARRDDDLMAALAAFFPRTEEEIECAHEQVEKLDEEEHSAHSSTSGESSSYGVPDYIVEDGSVRRKPVSLSSSHIHAPVKPEPDETVMRKYIGDDLHDIADLCAVTVAGADSDGRPILVWLQRKIIIKQVDLERLLVYLLRVGDEAASSSRCRQEFFLAYVQESCRMGNVPPLPWLWETIRTLSNRFGTKCRRIFIIGDALVRMVSFSLTFNLEIRERIRFLDTTEKLLMQFPGGRLRRDVFR